MQAVAMYERIVRQAASDARYFEVVLSSAL